MPRKTIYISVQKGEAAEFTACVYAYLWHKHRKKVSRVCARSTLNPDWSNYILSKNDQKHSV